MNRNTDLTSAGDVHMELHEDYLSRKSSDIANPTPSTVPNETKAFNTIDVIDNINHEFIDKAKPRDRIDSSESRESSGTAFNQSSMDHDTLYHQLMHEIAMDAMDSHSAMELEVPTTEETLKHSQSSKTQPSDANNTHSYTSADPLESISDVTAVSQHRGRGRPPKKKGQSAPAQPITDTEGKG